ncbi:MAG: cytochrome c [Burkholderiales bacterium]|nr:cytochrome c [Burkholderiales bacterium]
MNRRRLLWGTLVGVAVVAAGVGLALRFAPQAPGPVVLRPDDAALTALGQRLYTTHCASCHGANLEGQPDWRQRDPQGRLPAPPHDAGGHTWHHPDEVLFRITKLGVAKAAGMPGYDSAMPAYEGVLTDDEIVAVLSWIKSRWPAEVRAKHDGINRAAKARP